MLVLVKFRVGGNMRFLSHLETARVFERALVRAGFALKYSEGYNPHPKLSLVLPRAVGVESDAELLCVEMEGEESGFEAEVFKSRLSEELVEGLDVLERRVSGSRSAPRPASARYMMSVVDGCSRDDLRARIEAVLRSERLEVVREFGKGGRRKTVDVRGYIETIELEGSKVSVRCKISLSGSIRVDEVLKALGLDESSLALPVMRTEVDWQEV